MIGRRYRRRSRQRAFSLVESTIALGIAATAVSLVVGLLPIALSNAREAGGRSAKARVAEALFSEVRAANWADVDGLTNEVRTFDIAALPTMDSDKMVYTAVLSVEPSAGSAASTDSRRVKAYITDRPINQASLSAASVVGLDGFERFSTLVTSHEK